MAAAMRAALLAVLAALLSWGQTARQWWQAQQTLCGQVGEIGTTELHYMHRAELARGLAVKFYVSLRLVCNMGACCRLQAAVLGGRPPCPRRFLL